MPLVAARERYSEAVTRDGLRTRGPSRKGPYSGSTSREEKFRRAVAARFHTPARDQNPS
jgi:hypothetical protein